jgi:hypothetical protein
MSRSTRSRRRSTALLALMAVTATAMVGTSTASAGWSTYDPDTGNTDPAGYGSAPDPGTGTGNSSSSSGGGGVIATEVDSTVPVGGSSCRWTVKGHVLVRNPTLPGLSDGEPVAGIQVKVSGADWAGSPLGIFNSWGTDVTDSAGNFSVTHTECNKRRVRVEARFESDDLRVLGPSSPGWWELDDTDDLIEPSTIDLGGEPFGGETGEQRLTQAKTDAQTWILYRRAIDYLASIGYPALNHTTVHNPATLAPNGSWSDPLLHEIHIAPSMTDSVYAMLHEFGHAWAYPRELGETCLLDAVLKDADTHDYQETRCTAFNEGFADFFGHKLWLQMHDAGLLSSAPGASTLQPLSRANLVGKGLISLRDAEQNELGWDQAFRLLGSTDVTRWQLGPNYGSWVQAQAYTGPSCAGRGVPTGLDDLADALQVIGSSSDQFDLQDADDPTMQAFFDRADDRLAGFDSWDAVQFTNFADPAGSVEPHDAYGC